MAPDREWREAGVAEGVIPVTVRVDHRHEVSGKLPQVVAELIGQAVVRPRVDDRQTRLAPDRADRLVERLVPANPDPVGDLVPDRGHAPSWSMKNSWNAAAPTVGRELEDVGVVVQALRLVVASVVPAPADSDGPVALDGERLVVRLPAVRRIGLLEPAGDDRVAAAERVLVAVPGPVPVDRVLGEERLDLAAIV